MEIIGLLASLAMLAGSAPALAQPERCSLSDDLVADPSNALRSEVVRVLHERFGFDVLIFEADFYSLTRGWG